jgi:exosortase/archaeosortase family protein
MKNNNIFNSALSQFLLKSLALFFLWYLCYELWLAPQKTVDLFLNDLVVKSSTKLLQILHFAAYYTENNIYIDNKFSISVGTPCNGLPLFALFAGFILLMSGKVIHKLWFTPLGIGLIFVINILRVVLLAINAQYSPETFEMNHKYVYHVAVYSFICLLWWLWANKFADLASKPTA